jgi:hypothetical protein
MKRTWRNFQQVDIEGVWAVSGSVVITTLSYEGFGISTLDFRETTMNNFVLCSAHM